MCLFYHQGFIIFTKNTKAVIRKEGKILIVDDNKELLLAFKRYFAKWFTDIKTVSNPNLLISTIQQEWFDIILLDMNFSAGINSGNEGFYWLNRVLEHDADATVVLITAYADIDLAIRAMKEGATDFVSKTWDEEKILQTVLAAYRQRQTKQELSRVKQQTQQLQVEQSVSGMVIGQSAAMRGVLSTIAKVAPTDASVLLLGENGTGKEVLAQEIHRLSLRAKGLFVSVDLGALPDTLFESEMFGYTKGAFTDAKDDKMGRMEVASGGTLFLDELGNMPLTQQSKLLAAVQNGEVTRLGSVKPRPTDVRIVSATNMPLYQMVDDGRFRRDLLYRLNTIQIEIPPLRDRRDDIPALATHFLNRFAQKYQKSGLTFAQSGMEMLMAFSWPGNIRELQHVVEKAVILCDGSSITQTDISLHPTSTQPTATTLNLEENERQLVANAIEKCKGNMSEAARQLGINRTTLYQKIKRYGL